MRLGQAGCAELDGAGNRHFALGGQRGYLTDQRRDDVVRVVGHLDRHTLGVDQAVVAQRQVEGGGVARNDQRHPERLVHRHHGHRHLGLESRLEHDLVVVGDLGGHHRPGVAHRLAVQEGFLARQRARRHMHRGPEAVVLGRADLQRVRALGHSGKVDDAGGVSHRGGDHGVAVRVEQLHRGTGQIRLVGGEEGVLVGDGNLHVARGVGHRLELERHGHVAVAAHHVHRAVIALQRQVSARRQQQRDRGSLARSQVGNGGG